MFAVCQIADLETPVPVAPTLCPAVSTARDEEYQLAKVALDKCQMQKADLERQLHSERGEKLKTESILEAVQAEKALLESQLCKLKETSQ